MIYVAALLYSYVLIFLCARLPLALSFFLCSPLIMFSTLRGASGKDTELYLHRFYSLGKAGDAFHSFEAEPILNALIYFSKFFLEGPHQVFFLIHSSLVCILFLLILRKPSESRVFLYVLAPVFLIDGITNTMRVTLAYHFFIVGSVYSLGKLAFPFVFLSHVSGVLLYLTKVVVGVFCKGGVRRLMMLCAIFVLVLALVLLLMQYADTLSTIFPRVFGKVGKYQEMVLPTRYSGVADLFVLFSLIVVLGSFNGFRVDVRKFVKLLIFGLFVCFVFYFLIQQSLAFIRVVKLILVGICFSVFAQGNSKNIPSSILLLVGLVYSANFTRQIFFDDGFFPYPGEVYQ